jgi:hypothetical protein
LFGVRRVAVPPLSPFASSIRAPLGARSQLFISRFICRASLPDVVLLKNGNGAAEAAPFLITADDS